MQVCTQGTVAFTNAQAEGATRATGRFSFKTAGSELGPSCTKLTRPASTVALGAIPCPFIVSELSQVAPISPANLRELAELRLLIEGQALEDSFARGDVEWEAHVLAAYHRLARSEERMRQGDRSVVPDWKRFDWEFHQALISACGSRVLRQFHGANFDKYLRYQMIALSFRGDVASDEHHSLLDAAMARDADAARAILQQHLMGGVEHALASGTIGEGCVSAARDQDR